MNEKLSAFKKEIVKKKVAVIGLGISNTPLVEYLGKLGTKITVFDRQDKVDLKNKIEALKSYDIDFSLGKDYLKNLNGFDIIFKTPGIRPDIPQLVAEEKNGAHITSEIEVFVDLCPAKIIGITGSDGKTTTATITWNILKNAGYNCLLGGNIGTPLLNRLDQIDEEYIIVLELSSFQLLTMKKSPSTAVITNISPNHLNVHSSMEEYIEAKQNIYRYQTKDDFLVLNYDNEITRNLIEEAPGKGVYFSRTCQLEEGAFLEGDVLYFREKGITHEILNKETIKIPGNHNIENYLAAIAATSPYVNEDAIRITANSLTSIEHRIEFVREVNNVKYYNDSIGSSPSRTIATLNSFDKRVILIAGGYDKHIPYDSFGEKILKKVKHLILIGQTASLIEMAVMRKMTGKYRGVDLRITHCNTLQQAVDCAYLSAKAKDIVLMSPASASFDMFKNFEERGNKYKDYVMGL